MLEELFQSFISGFAAVFIAPIVLEIMNHEPDTMIEEKLVDTATNLQIAIVLAPFSIIITLLNGGNPINVISNISNLFMEFLGLIFGIFARVFYVLSRRASGPFKGIIILMNMLMILSVILSVIVLSLSFVSVLDVAIGLIIGTIAGTIGIILKSIIHGS